MEKLKKARDLKAKKIAKDKAKRARDLLIKKKRSMVQKLKD